MAASDGSVGFSDFTASRGGASHPNPTFDFLTGFAPRKLKDLFRWVEYLYYNSAHIFAALKKFAEYPITHIVYESAEKAYRDRWTTVLEKDLKSKGVSIKVGLDLQLYGNSFTSVYHPFDRFLKCNSCHALSGIKKLKYKFKLKTLQFKYTCPACDQDVTGVIEDKRVASSKRINVIRWDPKLIDINYNPITGECVYYYTIPNEIKTKAEKGDSHLLNTLPLEFIQAIKDDKTFEFAEGQLFHMKIDPPAGIEAQWGFPPLTSTIKLFFYAAILRKANESIALEHIVPFRVLHPAPISGTADPAMQLNMLKWRDEMKTNIAQWRRDPLHIMFAPAALGVTMMGGQGKSLLTLGEVKEAEDNIIAAMGIPREFLYGGLSFTGSAITLRMLENQLETYTNYLNEHLEWVIGQVSDILGWKPIEAKYAPFKLIDDAAQKQSLLNLNANKPLVSDTTILDLHDIDLVKEREKRESETLLETRFQMELQTKVQKLQQSLAQQAQQEASSGTGLSYNASAVVAQADQLVQQMQQQDSGSQRSFLSQLSQEDPVMYAVVKDRWQTLQAVQKQQATSQGMLQGGMQ